MQIGNVAFANLFNSLDFTHINNKNDPVADNPARHDGFRAVQGEIHIDRTDAWLSCPGQENQDVRCTDNYPSPDDIPGILQSLRDFVGPYNGIYIRC